MGGPRTKRQVSLPKRGRHVTIGPPKCNRAADGGAQKPNERGAEEVHRGHTGVRIVCYHITGARRSAIEAKPPDFAGRITR